MKSLYKISLITAITAANFLVGGFLGLRYYNYRVVQEARTRFIEEIINREILEDLRQRIHSLQTYYLDYDQDSYIDILFRDEETGDFEALFKNIENKSFRVVSITPEIKKRLETILDYNSFSKYNDDA